MNPKTILTHRPFKSLTIDVQQEFQTCPVCNELFIPSKGTPNVYYQAKRICSEECVYAVEGETHKRTVLL